MIKYFNFFGCWSLTCLIVVLSGCSNKSPTIPIQGDMEGLSEVFCLGPRIDVGDGFICKRYFKFLIEVEPYDTEFDEVRLEIAEKFEKKIVNKIRALFEKASLNEEIYYQGPIRGLDNEFRLFHPIPNLLRVEVHLSKNKTQQQCQNYWLLLISSDLYMRTTNQYCHNSDSSLNSAITNDVVQNIYEILENDLFK